MTVPRVPTYDNFQQMPAQFQPVQIQPATPRVDPGAQAASFGQATERAGAVEMDMSSKRSSRPTSSASTMR